MSDPLPKIEWPAEWSADEGWPSERIRVTDYDLPENQRKIAKWLQGRSSKWMRRETSYTLPKLCVELGKPERHKNPPLTMDLIRKAVLRCHRMTGEWPTTSRTQEKIAGRAWSTVNSWLLKHNSSLYLVCAQLGGPRHTLTRAWILRALRKHIRRTGRWPSLSQTSGELGRTWKIVDRWLRFWSHTTLHQLCVNRFKEPELVVR